MLIVLERNVENSYYSHYLKMFLSRSKWLAVVNRVVKFGLGFVFINYLYANELA